MPFAGLAIVGCGLIGGSFALGLKQAGFSGEIVGCDRAEVLERARRRGAIDRGTGELGEAVGTADLIYLATPVLTILELLPRLASYIRPGALVTDAGSTKLRICETAREVLPNSAVFLGGHPLAGRETSGIESADPKLFAGAKYVFTPETPEEMQGEAAQELVNWVRQLGAEPVVIDPETHDWALGMVSHLPQLLATALASTVADELEEDGLPVSLAADGFRDMTRLAASPAEIWRDICATNRETLVRALERLEWKLARLRVVLDSDELAEEFRRAKELRARLQK